MEAEILQYIQSNPSSAYLAVFGVLLACGLGVPLPEDISLVAGGYTVYLSQHHGLTSPALIPMILVGLVGVLSGDVFLFSIGRSMGPRITHIWPFRRLAPPKRMETVYRFFARYGVWTAFFARFAAGLRAPTFLLAGTARMRFRTFLIADGMAALISVPLLVWLAFHFGAEIDRVKQWLVQTKYVAGVLIAAFVVYLLFRAVRRYVKKRRQPPGGPSDSVETLGEASGAPSAQD